MKRYNAYKPSGIEWSEVIPESWRCCEIAHFTKSKSGGTPDRNKKSYWENGTIPWMSSGEVNKVNIFETDECITELGMQMSSAKMLEENTVVIALNGQGKTKAKSAILRIKSTCNQSLCGFKCDEKNLHYAYLFYCFQTMYKYLRSQAGDDSRDGISAYSVTKQRIPVPSLKEQKSISSYLDAKCAKIDNVLSVQQKRIELLKELKQSIITNAVTKGLDKNVELKPSGIEWIGNIPEKWKMYRLRFLASFKTGGTPEKRKGINAEGNGYNWVTAPDIKENYVINESEQYITKAAVLENGYRLFPPESILIVCIASVGKMGILKNWAYSNQQITAVKPNKLVFSKFLLYFLQSQSFKMVADASSNVLPIINTSYLSDILCCVPLLADQIKIASYLDKKCSALDSQISKIERQIELLKEYKQSIITECVTGKRKVC
jgi:type I restriction enzyme S subunit